MKGAGLYTILGAQTPRHFAIDVKPDYAGIAVFVRAEKGAQFGSTGVVAWVDLLAYLETSPVFGKRAGFVDLAFSEFFVPDLPGVAHGGIYKGRSYVFPNGMHGIDEIVDYSLIDIAVDHLDRPMPWRNRFAISAREKIDYSFRFRAREGLENALTVFLPFNAPLDTVRIELPCAIEPILLNGTNITASLREEDLAQDGQRFKQWFFRAVADADAPLTVKAGETLSIPYHLEWMESGELCRGATRFKLDADAGYIPVRRSKTDTEGKGSLAITALGLSAGDRVHVKLNAEHYSAVGVFAVEVV